MQLLAESSREGGDNPGFGLIPGVVKKLLPKGAERVPHMGWNEVQIVGDHPLFRGIGTGTDFYFVHSYSLACPEPYVIARTPYCNGFVSAVARETVMAVQFHPEKSQRAGFRLLQNFLAI